MQKLNLLEEPVPKLFIKYLMPSISATLVTSIYILADTLMIGRGVGAVGIAALNLLLPLFSLFFGTGMLFGVGGGVLLSISKGRPSGWPWPLPSFTLQADICFSGR